MPKYTAQTADRHELYEQSVQCVESDIDFVINTYRERRGKAPRLLKEDFCGTAAAAVEFVKRHKQNRAIGVDLDLPTLEYGREKHVRRLGRNADRVTLLNENVLDVREPLVDAVTAMNFSYFIFKQRTELAAYFAAARASLKPDGILFLDAYGGSQSQVPQREKRKLKGFTYVWDQASYCPITNDVVNHIHFKFPDGTRLKRAFTYEWRLWTLREITELLHEVGFRAADVYWEGWDEDGETGDGVFTKSATAENCEGWIAYIVAER